MARSKILVDSGFLYALYDQIEPHHEEAATIAALYDELFVIPYVVLTEAAYLFRAAGGVPSVLRFLDALNKAPYHYEIVSPEDLKLVRDIMARYADARLDFVDCSIMALSERLEIRQICTFDQRDFTIYGPKRFPFLEILP